ncbi:4Fe-4S binding protein [Vibrio kyushuensis]|uniref:FMN-binding protein n=1 Tax=Vibrio kyushuensis TaxID=2910249 RepID=UPI003D10B2BE
MSITLLAFCWIAGGQQRQDIQIEFLSHAVTDNEQLVRSGNNLFKVMPVLDEQVSSKWISIDSGVGYGGELSVATIISDKGQLESLSILTSQETSSYLDKVVSNKLPHSLLGKNIKTNLTADGVSGATLTSQAIVDATDNAADKVRSKLFGYQLKEHKSLFAYGQWVDAFAIVFFILAVLLNKSRVKQKAALNWGLLISSIAVFGFYSATLYSSTTMGALITGTWLQGVASYTPFILLLLSVGYILYFNRNIYCQSLCPFGAVQQCLAKIGNARSSTVRASVFIWFPRALLLVTLCLGAYFRNPMAFNYDPFGIMFGMVGGIYLFVLTVVIVLTSLVVRRPWCQSLCPINAMTEFVVFNKNWLKKSLKNKQKYSSLDKKIKVRSK